MNNKIHIVDCQGILKIVQSDDIEGGCIRVLHYEGDDDYYCEEESYANLENIAWEIFLAEARLRAKDDKNTWPPLFVPQTQTELLSILLRPHSPEIMEFIRERQCVPPSQQPVQTDAYHP